MKMLLSAFCVAICLFCLTVEAGSVTSAQTGNWGDSGTWDPDVPGADDDVTIASGQTVTITGTVQKVIKSLALNGTLKHEDNGTADNGYRIDLVISGNASINDSGQINVNGKGYAGGSGTHEDGYGPGGGGGSNAGGAGGGGYGGEGGDGASWTMPGGPCYGSVTNPVALGSGGGKTYGGYTGGAGAGAVKLDVGGTLTVDGDITANGEVGLYVTSHSAGSGAGGSIWLSAGTLTGTGTIQARGVGANHNPSFTACGGSGGGGRIAIYCATHSFVGSTTTRGGEPVQMDGYGRTGGAGTIYTKIGTDAPNLLIDNGITANMYGSAGTWLSNSTANTFNSITIKRYGILKHATETPMDVAIPTFTIEPHGSINVNGKGYAGGSGSHEDGYGPGGGGGSNAGGAGGGGYGGEGGDGASWTMPGGPCYGSVTNPVALGSGGGKTYNGYSGGAGGGAVKLTISEALTVDGTITANGNAGGYVTTHSAGSGAGGSVWISAGTLQGSGTIQANGERVNHDPTKTVCGGGGGGGGGGGRIAIHCTANSFTGTTTARGGEPVQMDGYGKTGGAGTIYTRVEGNPPQLLIDNATTDMYGTAGTWMDNSTANTFSSITLKRSGVLKHASGVAMDITVPTFTIEEYASINVSGRGHAGGSGSHMDGYGTGGGDGYDAGGTGGGGYGGEGGDGSSYPGSGGITYGSVTNPADFGSGGGRTYNGYTGGAGGGAVKLEVSGTLTVDGDIVTDGSGGKCVTTHSSGGGSGGSIWLRARKLTGSGSIRAHGGPTYQYPGYTVCGGSGGGGRIAIYYAMMTYNTNNVSVQPGTPDTDGLPGGVGTIYYEHMVPPGTVFVFR